VITVVDHDFGNIGSVLRALKHVGIEHLLTRDLREIEKAEKLILPGVGSFGAAARGFLTKDFRSLIRYRVLERDIPVFGFCLGMQLLAEYGEEMGPSEGLGLVKGGVYKLKVDPVKHVVPHMGWNDVRQNGLKMFKDVSDGACFYFVHSYEYIASDTTVETATVSYGEHEICAALAKGHIWGAQFHPEKSQNAGLQLIRNFERL
jgi:glutamine amidotransferase